jgi:4-amino-4-deoxy-L-arabinose transferase-like glycosyltransferase
MTVWRWLALILLAALLARVAFLVLFGDTLSLGASGYDAYAANLIEGQGYTRFEDRSGDSDLPPLYPFFLAGVYTVLGRDPLAVAAVQAVLDLVVVGLVLIIGRRVAGETVGLLAATFYGLYPYLLFQNLSVNDTGLFILLLAAGIALTYTARDSQHWAAAAGVGVALGLAALTKTLVLLLVPLLALWWGRQIGWRTALRLGLALGIALLAVVAPWIVRNTRLHGEFVAISTNGGSNLYQGNNPCVADYLARGWDAQWVDCLNPRPAGQSEVEADRWYRAQALDYLREHPGEWPRLLGTKLFVLWNPRIMPYGVPPDARLDDDEVLEYNTRAFQAARIVHLLTFGPLLVLGVIGLGLAWRNRLPVGPLVAVFAVITAAYLVFHPSTRYRAPADPFLFILSAYALARLWGRARAR